MSTIGRLKSIKNKILDKMITKESVSKNKDNLMLKGSYFKHLFNYIFFKKINLKDENTIVDLFFKSDNLKNIPKLYSLLALIILGSLTFLGFFLSEPMFIFLMPFIIFFILYLLLFFVVCPIDWFKKNNMINII